MVQPVLEVVDLTTLIRIGKSAYPVVENLSFNLYAGKTLALVGESGCGKSMTALSIMGIVPTPPVLPPKGRVLYRSQNLLQLSDRRMRAIRGKKIAMIFQDPGSALNPVYSVGEQLLESCRLHLDLYDDEAYERIIRALTEVGIPNPHLRVDDYPHQLSGGMKQRVMIAMALLCEPDILIADEPTTALDVTIQAQVLQLIRQLQKKKGMALLLITHDMGVVAEMADDVIVMYAANAVEKGDVYQIFDQMSHPYTRGLFNSRPAADIAPGHLKAIKGSVPPVRYYPQGCRFHPRCPFVMEKCQEGAVPFFTVAGEESHRSRCWLEDGTTESMRRREEVQE